MEKQIQSIGYILRYFERKETPIKDKEGEKDKIIVSYLEREEVLNCSSKDEAINLFPEKNPVWKQKPMMMK